MTSKAFGFFIGVVFFLGGYLNGNSGITVVGLFILVFMIGLPYIARLLAGKR